MNCPVWVRGEAGKRAGTLSVMPLWRLYEPVFVSAPKRSKSFWDLFYLYGFCSLTTEAKTGSFFAVTPFLPTPRI